MFYGSINGINIPNLHLYFFSKLNEETKTLTKNLFGGFAEKNDALIIVEENNNQVQVRGYLLISEINMIHSPYFEYLLNNTLASGGKDCTKDFYHSKCYKIVDWAIDSSLRTDSNLMSIFNQLAAICADVDRTVFVWTEHGNELIYYPIYASVDIRLINQSFARHFTNHLLTL